jgi:hypothetical protein
MSVLLVASWLAVPGLALAEDLRDEQAAQAKVNANYGNRKPSEMSNEERRQAAQDQQAAGLGVMEKHGVSDKDYARQTARMGPEERAAVALAEKKLEEKDKAAKAAEQKKAQEKQDPDEIPIQQGINDENPVELESSGDAPSVVEQGLPPGESGAEEPAAASAEAPGKKGRK